jgi:hypothetical protein
MSNIPQETLFYTAQDPLEFRCCIGYELLRRKEPPQHLERVGTAVDQVLIKYFHSHLYTASTILPFIAIVETFSGLLLLTRGNSCGYLLLLCAAINAFLSGFDYLTAKSMQLKLPHVGIFTTNSALFCLSNPSNISDGAVARYTQNGASEGVGDTAMPAMKEDGERDGSTSSSSDTAQLPNATRANKVFKTYLLCMYRPWCLLLSTLLSHIAISFTARSLDTSDTLPALIYILLSHTVSLALGCSEYANCTCQSFLYNLLMLLCTSSLLLSEYNASLFLTLTFLFLMFVVVGISNAIYRNQIATLHGAGFALQAILGQEMKLDLSSQVKEATDFEVLIQRVREMRKVSNDFLPLIKHIKSEYNMDEICALVDMMVDMDSKFNAGKYILFGMRNKIKALEQQDRHGADADNHQSEVDAKMLKEIASSFLSLCQIALRIANAGVKFHHTVKKSGLPHHHFEKSEPYLMTTLNFSSPTREAVESILSGHEGGKAMEGGMSYEEEEEEKEGGGMEPVKRDSPISSPVPTTAIRFSMIDPNAPEKSIEASEQSSERSQGQEHLGREKPIIPFAKSMRWPMLSSSPLETPLAILSARKNARSAADALSVRHISKRLGLEDTLPLRPAWITIPPVPLITSSSSLRDKSVKPSSSTTSSIQDAGATTDELDEPNYAQLGLTLLLISTDAHTKKSLERSLKSIGCRLQTAGTIEEAARIAEQGQEVHAIIVKCAEYTDAVDIRTRFATMPIIGIVDTKEFYRRYGTDFFSNRHFSFIITSIDPAMPQMLLGLLSNVMEDHITHETTKKRTE